MQALADNSADDAGWQRALQRLDELYDTESALFQRLGAAVLPVVEAGAETSA